MTFDSSINNGIYTFTGGNLYIDNGSTLAFNVAKYAFSGQTFSFDSNGGGTFSVSESGANGGNYGGFVLNGGITIATSGGAQDYLTQAPRKRTRASMAMGTT